MTAVDPDLRPLVPIRPAAGRPAAHALPRPRRASVLDTDLLAVLGGFALLAVGTWVRHGGAGALTSGWAGFWTALSQLTGLAASGVGLVGVALAARPAGLEQRWGLDRLFVWHRILGETMAVLVGLHVCFGVAEWATGEPFGTTIADLTGRQPYMAGAAVGAALVGLVTISSLRSIRRRLAYETWYFVHLLAYAGLALSFSHEIVIGGDFSDDRLARAVWVLAHAGVAVWIVWGRWGRLLRSYVRPLRVEAARPLNADTVELTLGGPGLRDVRSDAGQFLMLRPLTSRLWWQAHPFSLSGAPDRAGLRFTVKRRGDASGAIAELPVGTRVAVEGPYGACTPEVLENDRVLFVVGGVGIAPALSLLERLPATAQPIVLYRAHAEADLVHLDRLRARCAELGGEVHVLVGPTAALRAKDPFSARVLARAVPDVADRVAVLCGPERLLVAARAGLREAGVPAARIHYERVWW